MDRAIKVNPFEPKEKPSFDLDGAFWTPQDNYTRTYLKFTNNYFYTATVQNIAPILRLNYFDRLNSDENWRKNKDWKHVARIPYATYLEWQRLGITEDSKALLKALEMNKQFKTTTKRL